MTSAGDRYLQQPPSYTYCVYLQCSAVPWDKICHPKSRKEQGLGREGLAAEAPL